jgi:hypothetical protein
MLKSFANNQPLVLVFVPLLVLAHLTLDIYFPTFEGLAVGQENLWKIDFNQMSTALSRSGAFLMVSANAVLINYVFNTHEFFERNNYLPSLVYVLLVFMFPMSLRLGEDLIGHTFFMLAVHYFFNVKQNVNATNTTFLCGLFIGFAATFLPVYIYFLPIVWLGVISIRPLIWREFFLPIVGAMAPLMWVFLIDQQFYLLFIGFDSGLDYSRFGNILVLIPHVVVLALIILSNRNILRQRLKSSIRYKRLMGLVLYTLLFSVLSGSIVLVFFNTYFYFTIGAVILSIVLPYAYLGVKRKWFPAFLFYVLIILNVVKFMY